MRRLVWIVFLIVAFIVGGLVGSWARGRSGADTVPLFVATSGGAAISNQVNFTNGFIPVAHKVLPAVVNISSSKIVRAPNHGPTNPFFSDPFFRQFFGNPNITPRPEREHSLGSGVIVSGDGYILTNNHVVAGATEIKVMLPDRRELTGKIVGTDPKTDLAVVKVNANKLPVITLGDSSHVQVGEFALAVGNPFGVGETMTMGIVSATGRSGLGIETYEDFIQTDAAINPGNSGGALVNPGGELIGINTAILTGGGGGNQGVGFAIPVNLARRVMDQILKTGKVTRGWIGVEIQNVTPSIAQAFDLSGAPRGALVSSVKSGGPAAKAGLQQGDIIVALDGQPVTETGALSLKISMMAPGTVVKLSVFRNGKEITIPVTLAEMPSSPEAGNQRSNESGGPRLGLSVEPLTPDAARQLGLPGGSKGVVVTDVDPAGAAAAAGIARGDVIEGVNRKPVNSVDAFAAAVRAAGNQPVVLLIDRGGNHFYVAIQSQ